MTATIRQVLVGAAEGDAITSMALRLRAQLAALGASEVYAHYLASEGLDGVRPIGELPPPAEGDLLVYHASYGEPRLTHLLLERPEPLVLVYHNITPAEHFRDFAPEFAYGLEWGRHELSLLASKVVLAVADSAFNATDLAECGYDTVHVVPAGVRPHRLAATPPDPAYAAWLRHRFPDGFVIAVSQVLPHKRFEDLVEAMHLVHWVHGERVGLLVVGRHRFPDYARALALHASRLRIEPFELPGALADAELSAAFRMAAVYVTTSAHEGLAIPPLEAMALGVPVVARAAGALPETVGDAGIVLPADAGPCLVAEAVVRVLRDPALGDALRQRGYEHVDRIAAHDPGAAFVQLIGSLPG